MPLKPGTRLGPYEIAAQLGAGGMGEVYRARDTRLGRDVALKILPADVANDPARRQRFEQEARAVAALNHPNIVALYDVGDGYIITELVDGEPLRTAKLSLRKALDLAAQIASGLAVAHEAGIVHRDLKPDNILLTRDGHAKILDFGLAKVTTPRSATQTQMVTVTTEPGTVMGTVGYMSPEQVRGAGVDARSDIFNLGLILHELLTGHRTFNGETSVEVMTAILRQDAPELPEHVPVWIRQVVARCLEKNPAERFQSARDLAFGLSLSTGRANPVHAPKARQRGGIWILAALAGVVSGLLVGFFLWRAVKSQSWTGAKLGGPEVAWTPRVSPGGHTLAMLILAADQSQVAVMRPDVGDWVVLTHDRNAGAADALSWSPDANRIYYDRVTEVPKGVYSVAVLGGESRLELENAAFPEALPDGSLLVARFNSRGELRVCRLWRESGKLREFPFQVDFDTFRTFRVFPGAREAAVFGSPVPPPDGQGARRLYVLNLDSGQARPLPVETGFAARTVAVTRDGGSVLFPGDGGGVLSISVAGGAPARTLFPTTGLAYGMDTAPDGSVFVDQVDRPPELLRITGGHALRAAASLGSPNHQFALLPDGRAVSAQMMGGRSRLIAIETGKEPSPLIATSEESTTPVTPAGPGMLAFLIGHAGKQEIAIATVSTGRILRRIPFDQGAITMMSASASGDTLYCVGNHTVWAVPAAGGPPVRMHDGDAVAADPAGNYLAVMTQDPERTRLYKVPLHGGAALEITVGGGLRPKPYFGPEAISRDGRLLVPLTSADSWFYHPGVIDLATGKAAVMATDYQADYVSLNWTADGQVVGIATPMRSSIWKFTPH